MEGNLELSGQFDKNGLDRKLNEWIGISSKISHSNMGENLRGLIRDYVTELDEDLARDIKCELELNLKRENLYYAKFVDNLDFKRDLISAACFAYVGCAANQNLQGYRDLIIRRVTSESLKRGKFSSEQIEQLFANLDFRRDMAIAFGDKVKF